jgi:peptidyl-dipeptidase A
MAALLFGTLAAACGGGQPVVASPPAAAPPAPPPAASAATESARPTVEDARAFLSGVERDLRKLWVARDRAAWVNQNFITDDTEALSAAGEEATAEYVTKAIHEARRFAGLELPADLARQLKLLTLAQVVPAPTDPAERAELAQVETWMTSAYGKGTYCPPAKTRPKGSAFRPGKCMKLDDLSRVMKSSRIPGDLLEAWVGWHAISPPIREKFARYVELGNAGAREIGFEDLGALWRSGYDMSPAELEADVERLWGEVKPLYDELHCYVRARLAAKYGEALVPAHGPIPAHLLGNMWAQEWGNIYDLVEPYPKAVSLDVDERLRKKKWEPKQMVQLGERFFTSLGLDPLPQTFWERSLLTRPRDRDVVCHASAWDVTWSDDLRIKMCIEPTEEDLVTIHHELGHDYYFHQYWKLPILFQGGANDGFHEGIGDTLALSVNPSYLKSVGLLDAVPSDEKAKIDVQLKDALDKIAFLPFGLLVDKWRWDVFSGKTPKDKWNQSWWELRRKYQGVSEPAPRTEQDFDPGAKFHVPASTPYLRYFLARIYQFQFHRALCKAAGHTGPLDTCSIYGNAEAGKRLRAMLDLGASKPWQDAMEAISGERKADASAILEYFAPLRKFLAEQNRGRTCGW